MKILGTRLAVAPVLLLAAALGAAPAAAQGGILGEVVGVENRAEFSLRGAPLRELRPKMPMVREMRVVTYTDSDALMTYDHPRAMLFLGPETEFLVRPAAAADEYRCPDPELVERLADLEQTRGELRVVRERAQDACPLRLLTQVAVIVVTGTDFTVRVDPADGTTVVAVAEGSVDVYRRDPDSGEPRGEPVGLEAGDVSVVAPGRAPSLPAPADPGPSLLSPATEAPSLLEPLGAPYGPGLEELVDLICDANPDLRLCEGFP
ncbi:MAG TPA: FecR family protein, partial [Thermoanaerobaculia bacterium]